MRKKVVRYLVIGVGVVISLAILVLTVINVRRYQQRLTLASPIDCSVNWCQGEVVNNQGRYMIFFSRPISKKYPLRSFAYNLKNYKDQKITVKGVVRNGYFYITSVKK